MAYETSMKHPSSVDVFHDISCVFPTACSRIFSMFSTCCTWKFSIYSAASCTVAFRVSKTTSDSKEESKRKQVEKHCRDVNRTADHFREKKVDPIFFCRRTCPISMYLDAFADIPLVWKNMSRRGGNQSKLSYDKIARNKSGFIFKILKKKPRGGQNGNLNHISCGPWFSAFGRCDWTLKISCHIGTRWASWFQLQVGGP